MNLLHNIHHFDLKAFYWFLDHLRNPTTTALAKSISYTANGPLYVIAGLVFLLFEQWYMGKLMLITFLIERLCYCLFKSLFRRNRPSAAIPGYKSAIEPGDQFSFPSGHTSGAFVIATLLTLWSPWCAWIMYPWAISVGISRVILGVHFPTDTLAGATLGISICYISVIALDF